MINFRFLLFSVAATLLLPTNSSLATVISSTSHTSKPLVNYPNYQAELSQTSLTTFQEKIVLSKSLQNELEDKIIQAKQELQELSQRLSVPFTNKFGIVYFHQGQNYWHVKFTFGGLLLNIDNKIIFTTKKIFILKKYFEQTNWIEIKGQQYPTTGSMKQLGPILHSPTSYQFYGDN